MPTYNIPDLLQRTNENLRDDEPASGGLDLDLANLTNDALADLCHNPDAENVNSTTEGRRIVKVSPKVVIKSDWTVMLEEAANQQYAYSCGSDFRVPKVYRYFRSSGKGYLVMEYLDGISLDRIPSDQHQALIPRLAKAINSLADRTWPGPPGPRNGGIPQGVLFSEDGALQKFTNMAEFNSWLNHRARLGQNQPFFHYKPSDLAFCHLDLARRNIVLLPDQSFGLLDWEHAGLYPRIFEHYCLRFAGRKDYFFTQALMKALGGIFLEEPTGKDCELAMLNRIYGNNLRYE